MFKEDFEKYEYIEKSYRLFCKTNFNSYDSKDYFCRDDKIFEEKDLINEYNISDDFLDQEFPEEQKLT